MADDARIGVDEQELDDAALEALAEAVAAAPRAALRDRVLDTVRATPREDAAPPPRTTPAPTALRPAPGEEGRAATRWRIVGGVAAAVTLALGGLLARERTRLGDVMLARDAAVHERDAAEHAREVALQERDAVASARDAMAVELAAQGRTLAALRETLATQAEVLRVVGGPHTVMASLQPTAQAQGTGRAHLDRASGRGAVIVAGVGALPADRGYELWALRGDAPPQPAGMLRPVADDVLVAEVSGLQRADEVTGFAVSVEPSGGSPQPTGPIVLVGSVAS